MTREYLYQGKRKDNGEWATGSLLIHRAPLVVFTSDKKEPDDYYILESGFADWHMPRPILQYVIDPKTLRQSTGWIDRKHARVWEGDIVEGHSDGVVVVRYNVVMAMWEMEFLDEEIISLWEFQYTPRTNVLDGVVVGNIFDNKDLLNNKDLSQTP